MILTTAVYTYFNLARQGEPGYAHTTNILGGLNGANSGGAFVGCIISAWAADKYSRKKTIQFACVVLVIGGALNAGSVNITMFAIGRVVAGIGSGILAVVVPMYQGEIATAETRGAMMCVTGVMWAYGYSFAGWVRHIGPCSLQTRHTDVLRSDMDAHIFLEIPRMLQLHGTLQYHLLTFL